jgi:hypothetical protein
VWDFRGLGWFRCFVLCWRLMKVVWFIVQGVTCMISITVWVF